MAPTIAAIMQGIETRLETIAGLRVSSYVADQINPPQAFVGVPEIPDYHATMRRARITVEPTVTVLVSAALDRVGQMKLAEFANPDGALSVVAAIEGDRKLGGVVDDCIVASFRPLGLEEVGLIGYYGGVFALRVAARGV
ncbi:hypothetical protein E1295_31880 [Nonomuraea mesophila]|uniref:Uncharacterized protein n=1 Tax=Nonomuraea mesophila TaxID=2530382 RepID=A0A4R5EZJ3_9ACTN|nr:hypothetical protein [Nonomuraea mesophila]TDE40501.1 hypothetical protein E1295_31880 [Nonomuraea mesophila]